MNLKKAIWISSSITVAAVLLKGVLEYKRQANSGQTEYVSNTIKMTAILSQSREIVPGGIWDREILGLAGGTLQTQVTGAPPFHVTIVTDAVYHEMVTQNKTADEFTSGVFVNSRSDAETFLAAVRLEKGKFWISISNRSEKSSLYDLQCHSWKPSATILNGPMVQQAERKVP